MSVATNQRFTSNRPCPICHGFQSLKRGTGKRCAGYISEDGLYAYCSREEYAFGLPINEGANAYKHRMRGKCNCGVEHGAELPGYIIDLSDWKGMNNLPVEEAQEPVKKSVKYETLLDSWIEKFYNYTSQDGEIVMRVVRYRLPDGDKTFRQWQPDPNKDGWVRNIDGAPRVPYQLPNLIKADKSELIFIVEGEKDVETLMELNAVATTNPMGAKKWPDDFKQYFVDRHVVIIPDNDKDGELHAAQVYKNLQETAASIRLVKLPDNKEKGDVTDWLELGHNIDEIDALIKTAPIWERPKPPTFPLLTYEDLCNLPDPEWLVKPELVKGYLTLLYGPSHTGKSFVALDYALQIAQEQLVVYMIGENANGYKYRVRAWCDYHQKTPGNILFLKQPVQLLQMDQVLKLQETLNPHRPVLVVIDTLSKSYAGGDENDAQDMRTFISACESLRNLYGCAVMVVHHTGRAGANPRGSSLLDCDFDARIAITKTEEKKLIKLTNEKQKDAPQFPDKMMRIHALSEEFEFTSSCVAIPDADAQAAEQASGGPQISEKAKSILLTLEEKFSQEGASFSELLNYMNVPYTKDEAAKQAWYRALKDLQPTFVKQPKPRGPYLITIAGRDLLGLKGPNGENVRPF